MKEKTRKQRIKSLERTVTRAGRELVRLDPHGSAKYVGKLEKRLWVLRVEEADTKEKLERLRTVAGMRIRLVNEKIKELDKKEEEHGTVLFISRQVEMRLGITDKEE